MSLSVLLSCIWVLACTVVAFLPMRRQYAPGIALLATLPVLLVYLGIQHGPWVPLVLLIAAISLFRRPLGYFLRYLRGRLS